MLTDYVNGRGARRKGGRKEEEVTIQNRWDTGAAKTKKQLANRNNCLKSQREN